MIQNSINKLRKSVNLATGFLNFNLVRQQGAGHIKESVRVKLKVIVKRTLKQYGYPPDMQLLATEMVLQQAEMIAGKGCLIKQKTKHADPYTMITGYSAILASLL